MTRIPTFGLSLSPNHAKEDPLRQQQQQQQQQQSQEEKLMKEIEKRQGRSATYTQPLIGSTIHQQQDIESFLTEWYGSGIFYKNREMQQLLRQHSATIGTHYSLLVPERVSFDQFWARYFYKCSRTTILEEWRSQEQDCETIHEKLALQIGPTIQEEFQKRSAEHELGTLALKTTPADEFNRKKRDDDNNDDDDSNNNVYQEAIDRAAARAALMKNDHDIVESSCSTIMEDEQEDSAIGIGFAETG